LRSEKYKQAIAVEFWELLTDKRNQSMAELIKTGPFCDKVTSSSNSWVNSFFFQNRDMTKEKKA